MKKLSLVTMATAMLMPLSAGAVGVQVIIDGKSIELSDVQQSMWFATYVQQSAEAGIVTGYKDASGKPTGKFGPSNSITVAEALKIAVEGAGYNETEYGRLISSGVSHWSSAYVSVAKAEGFPVTFSRSTLDRPATRAQVAAIFAAAFQAEPVPYTTTRYSDVKLSTTYSASIEILSQDKILSGDTDAQGNVMGTFRPAADINRAEVAKMVIAARTAYGTPGEDRSPSAADGDNMVEKNLVMYTADGFLPNIIYVKKGENVTFRNDTATSLSILSDTASGYPALTSTTNLNQGSTFVVNMTKLGTFTFHNKASAAHKGTIVVQE